LHSRVTSPGLWVTTPRHLQCPTKSTVPSLGAKCGRRERESRREGRREQSLRGKSIPSRIRNGERHSDFLEGITLRGVVSERRSRSVRHSVAVSPATKSRADDSECPEGRRGGERRQHAPQSACTQHTHERSSHVVRGRVLRSVLRPVHVNPHYAPAAQVDGGGANESASRLGKPG